MDSQLVLKHWNHSHHMGQKYTQLSEKLTQFILQQQMYFVGTADVDGRVSVSPKGLDTLRIINKNRLIWLNLTGSGNETSAHIQRFSRMTIMFCSFVGKPMILRLYGTARVVHKNDKDWLELYENFDDYIGARQIFKFDFDLVQTSCGTAVPLYEFQENRGQLIKSFERRGEEGTQTYWKEKNYISVDGKETHIVEKNL